MSRIGKASARAVKRLERDTEAVVTIAGTDYPCVANTSTRWSVFGEGGFALETDLTVYLRLEVCPTVPSINDLVTFDGNSYRVLRPVELPGDGTFKLICGDPDRAA
jgi:hypothetical protein